MAFKRVKYLLLTYFLFVLFFMVQKPVFLLYHYVQSVPEGFLNAFKVIGHGIPMDLSIAGYFTVLPLLVLGVSIYFSGKWFGTILSVYFLIVSLFISLIFIPDLELYSYWGFRIDSTVLTYIMKPAEAAASVPGWVVAVLLFVIICWTIAQFAVLNRAVAKPLKKESRSTKRVSETVLFILLAGLMFIAIRGGVTTSTMNESKVYFSKNMFLNHAAVNPVYNMIFSLKLNEDFDTQYRFMDDQEAERIFRSMNNHKVDNDSVTKVLKTERPNVVIILLESFGAKIMQSSGGLEGVAPHLEQLSKEGVFFPNMYANSFRTDRGLVSVLSGYPAQPTMSIAKYSKKCQSLGSIPETLSNQGYKTSFLYGGDVDFAYMKSYLITQKVTDITSDKDFSFRELLNKWGAPDQFTFERLLTQIKEEKQEPFCKIFLTLSSHEPFDVPTKKFAEPYLNSVAYTDSCLGQFVAELKQTPQWDNTLLILVPDHDMFYPSTLQFYEPDRFDIFMIWTGGAVKTPLVVDPICSQTDIAATLLGQLDIDYSPFIFSRNLFSASVTSSAFYDFPNGFGVMSPEGKIVFDCGSNQLLYKTGRNADRLLLEGKAYLQSLYNDIQKR